MKNTTAIVLLLLILGIDIYLTVSNLHAIFDKTQYLPTYILSRLGILAISIYITRLRSNWLYVIGTSAYLLFSFLALSVLHFSYIAQSQSGV